MTSAADRGRRRARAATWTLVVGAAAGATAVAGVAAASTPARTGTQNHAHSQPATTHRDSRGELGHEHADGEHDGHRSTEQQTPISPAHHQRHHRHHRARLSPPTSSQPSATSSGS